MASSMALRRLTTSSNLVNKLFNPIRSISVSSPSPSITTATRSFNTNNNTQMSKFEDDERGMDIDRRRSEQGGISRRRSSDFLSDVFDPFSPTRSLSQVFNMMDRFMENPFSTGSNGGGGGLKRGWDVKEDENALYFKVDMPGLGKEDIKLSVEHNTLIIKGEGEKETEESSSSSSRRRYSSRIDLPPNLYKTDEIKAEMKNGILKISVPKVKEEERKDVFQVNVE